MHNLAQVEAVNSSIDRSQLSIFQSCAAHFLHYHTFRASLRTIKPRVDKHHGDHNDSKPAIVVAFAVCIEYRFIDDGRDKDSQQ